MQLYFDTQREVYYCQESALCEVCMKTLDNPFMLEVVLKGVRGAGMAFRYILLFCVKCEKSLRRNHKEYQKLMVFQVNKIPNSAVAIAVNRDVELVEGKNIRITSVDYAKCKYSSKEGYTWHFDDKRDVIPISDLQEGCEVEYVDLDKKTQTLKIAAHTRDQIECLDKDIKNVSDVEVDDFFDSVLNSHHLTHDNNRIELLDNDLNSQFFDISSPELAQRENKEEK